MGYPIAKAYPGYIASASRGYSRPSSGGGGPLPGEDAVISGHNPTSGATGEFVSVFGTDLPTSGWGTDVSLVLDDGFGVNTFDASDEVVSINDTTFIVALQTAAESTYAHLRITNSGGSVTESPSGGYTNTDR